MSITVLGLLITKINLIGQLAYLVSLEGGYYDKIKAIMYRRISKDIADYITLLNRRLDPWKTHNPGTRYH
jgi:hypothetical protein